MHEFKLSLLPLLLTAFFSQAAFAEDPRWFTIELLIFKNGGNAWQKEEWRSNPELFYPEPLLISSALSLAEETEMPIRELEFTGTLADAAAKLKATGQYRILYSRRWQQGLLKTKNAPNLLITGGDPHGEHYELEGSMKFSVERYLHINTNLWFTTFGQPEESTYEMAAPSLPAEVGSDDSFNPPDVETDRREKYSALYNEDDELLEMIEDDEEWQDFEEDFEEPMSLPLPPWVSDSSDVQEPIRRVVTLQQHRRLRSRETHYIDHPSLGILIRIEPLENKTEEINGG